MGEQWILCTQKRFLGLMMMPSTDAWHYSSIRACSVANTDGSSLLLSTGSAADLALGLR